jgi:ribonuclease HI
LTSSRKRQKSITKRKWDLPTVFHLYADGSASHLTQDGGWAFIIQSDEGLIAQDAGHIPGTTNNAMEIYAIVQGLKHFSKRSHVIVYSDSAYVVNTMNNEWWKEWQKNGWKKQSGKETPNKNYWEEIISLVGKHDVEFVKVKAHNGDTLNERCDKLAKEARKWGHPLWTRDFTEIE